jgi:hypothetical protein
MLILGIGKIKSDIKYNVTLVIYPSFHSIFIEDESLSTPNAMVSKITLENHDNRTTPEPFLNANV